LLKNLKLVDFPFSYSMIGTLFLQSGRPIIVEGSAPAQFVPPLFLTVRLGTALAIVDPVGRLIRLLIHGPKFGISPVMNYGPRFITTDALLKGTV
jgi:hypothetical protein